MEFKKYNSIENAYQEQFIQNLILQGFSDIQYIVQEKVHGANFSFITDGTTITMAKRTGILEENEIFYNANKVLTQYQSNILDLYNRLSQTLEFETLTIFGELFGGSYPHKEVPKTKEARMVQKGVYYAPHNDFFAFDIRIDNRDYVDLDVANALFEACGFIYAKPLMKGNLKECLAYPNEFTTTLPPIFGLPELEDNICEGVVIKPIKARYMRTGSRVIIKNKNERWSEKTNKKKRPVKNVPALSETAKTLCENASQYINENRFNNVVSKIGEVDFKKQYGRLLGMFNKDILEDFLKDYGETYNTLEKKEQKSINKYIGKLASAMINKIIVEQA